PAYLMHATVHDDGENYILSADLEATGLSEDPTASWLLGGAAFAFAADGNSRFDVASSQLTLTVERAGLHPLMLETSESLTFSPPFRPEGVPTSTTSPSVSIAVSLALSGFDDRSIQIEPPL